MAASNMNVTESVVLNDGNRMPVIALGTSRMKIDETAGLIKTAVDLGYRHIDTGQVYWNFVNVGNGLHDVLSTGKVKREDVFITTKLVPFYEKPGDLEEGLRNHLSMLNLDYVDACLIHMPFSFKLKFERYREINRPPYDMSEFVNESSNHIEQWRELEDLKDKGLTKSIGLSNFSQTQIQNILNHCRVPPAILQVECHLYLQIPEFISFCNRNNFFVICFAALGSPGIEDNSYKNTSSVLGDSILNDPVVKVIAESNGKAAAQVFDFSLSANDFETLSKLDKGQRIFDLKYYFRTENYHLYPFPGANNENLCQHDKQ